MFRTLSISCKRMLNKPSTYAMLLTLASQPSVSQTSKINSEDSEQANSVEHIEMTTVIGPKESPKPFSQPLLTSASTIINRDTLERLKFQEPVEVLERISGASQVRNLRLPISSKSYTLVMVDGLAMTNPYSSSMSALRELNNRDIERIEITKGLGSSRNAASAFGGTINVYSKKPSNTSQVQTDLEGGSYNRLRGGVQASGIIGQHSYSADISRQTLEGYRDEFQNDRNQASLKGMFALSEHNQLVLRGEFLDRYERYLAPLTESEYQEDTRQAGSGLGSDEHIDTWTLSLADTHQLDDASQLRFSSLYRKETTTGINLFTQATDAIRTDIDSRLEYQRNIGSAGLINIGASYLYGHSDFTRFSIGRDNRPNRERVTTDSISHTNISAGYFDYQLSPLRDVTLNAGVRFERVDLDSFNKRNQKKVRTHFKQTDPRLGVSWQFHDQHSLWSSYSEGFYTPNTRQLYTDRFNANPDLKAEQLTSYEFGLRGQLPLKSLQYSVNWYDSDIDDFIVVETNFIDGQRQSRFSNAGLVNARGIEMDLDLELLSNLSTGLSYTYTDNIYKRYSNPFTGKDLSGNTLARSPDHHWNLRLRFEPFTELSVELEWDGISSYHTNDDNQLDPAGTFSRDDKWHLRASYGHHNLKFWLHLLNLTSTLEDDVTYSRNQRFYDIGSDATTALGLSYQFQ